MLKRSGFVQFYEDCCRGMLCESDNQDVQNDTESVPNSLIGVSEVWSLMPEGVVSVSMC